MLNLVAARLRSAPVTTGIEANLKGLEELELRATGSWAIVATAQSDWITTAIQYLESVRAGTSRQASGPIPTGPTTSWRASSPRCGR